MKISCIFLRLLDQQNLGDDGNQQLSRIFREVRIFKRSLQESLKVTRRTITSTNFKKLIVAQFYSSKLSKSRMKMKMIVNASRCTNDLITLPILKKVLFF